MPHSNNKNVHADKYEEEVVSRWGDTQEFKESHTRTAGYTKKDFEAARLESNHALDLLIAAMEQNLPPSSDAAIEGAKAHQDAISHWYYECSDEIHLGLADMYVADHRFTEYYEVMRPGLAQYLHDAIYAKSPGIRV